MARKHPLGSFPFPASLATNEESTKEPSLEEGGTLRYNFKKRFWFVVTIFQYVTTWICSAVIISPRFLVTAAHCKTKEDVFRVSLGVFHLSKELDYKKLDLPSVQTFGVIKKDFVIHDDYGWIRRDGKSTVINDIGLIKIPRDAD